MQNPFTGWTRRYFLQGAGLTSLMGGLGLRPLSAAVNDRKVRRAPAKHGERFTKSLACGPSSMRLGRIQR